MADPVITSTERYSDSINLLHMSNGSTLFGCSWPKCNFTSENAGSIPSHYKTHVGQAAQRRRAQRRPRSAEVTSDVLDAALALLDMVQTLVDRIDAFEDTHQGIVQENADLNIALEAARQLNEETVRKAEAYDEIQRLLGKA